MIRRRLLWSVGFTLIGLGCFTVFTAHRPNFVANLPWDPSTVGVGVTVMAIGLFFLDRVTSQRT